MSGFRINFSLKPLCEIVPWDYEHNKSLSWFGMTYGELWITVGKQTIYEYSNSALNLWDSDIRYNDYQISRFLEDFSRTFNNIRESIPEKFYNKVEELDVLFDKWKERHFGDDDKAFDMFCEREYLPLTKWFYRRVFYSGHLVGGPFIGCFRSGDMIKIRWRSDYTLENGYSIWAFPSGHFELRYRDFIKEVNRFFDEFFVKMDDQVTAALSKDWGTVYVDKERLVKENRERREGFKQSLELLVEDCLITDWSKPFELYDKLCRELFQV